MRSKSFGNPFKVLRSNWQKIESFEDQFLLIIRFWFQTWNMSETQKVSGAGSSKRLWWFQRALYKLCVIKMWVNIFNTQVIMKIIKWSCKYITSCPPGLWWSVMLIFSFPKQDYGLGLICWFILSPAICSNVYNNCLLSLFSYLLNYGSFHHGSA